MKKKEPKTTIDDSVIEEAVRAVDQHKTTPEPPAPAPEKKEPPKADDLYDRLLRVTADYENFRKRTQKEKSDLVLYGNENLLRDILPILDNFERAVEHAKKTDDVQSIRTGVELILSQLETTLERMGLTSEPSVGQTFDPLIHEAVNHVVSDGHPPNTIMEEHQKAYFLHKRLLRPALVTVSKGPDDKVEDPKVSDEKKE